MSGYDLAVWFSDVAMDRERAENFLLHVARDWVILRRHPSFDAFWVELHDRFPNTPPGTDHLATLDAPPYVDGVFGGRDRVSEDRRRRRCRDAPEVP